MKRIVLALLTLLSLSFLGSNAFAADKLRLERADVSHWPSVRMYLSYVDGDGRVVTGRGKESFKLALDSAEQGSAAEAKTFDTTGEPVNVVIVAQVSGAMNEVIDEVQKGVRAIADSLDAKTKPKMALLGYAAETKRLSELGSPADAESAAKNMAVDTEGVEVHMLDAVRTAIDLLNAAPKTERKLIILFSDGINVSMERRDFTNIAKKAADAGIVIDTIGYAPFEAGKLKNLQELSKASNGTDRSCKSASEVTAQFMNVSDEIKKQYLVTFEALLNADGKMHQLQAIVDAAGRTAYSNVLEVKIPDKNVRPPKEAPGKKSRLWLWILLGVIALVVILGVLWLVFREKDEEMAEEAPAAAPQPQAKAPEAAGPMKTMALNVGSAAGGAPMVGWIVALSGKHSNQTFKFKPVRTLIGTGQDCDIVVDDQFMSSHHCEVRLEPGGFFKLVDLGSTNGIVVNNKKVKEHELVDNDQFRLGRTEFKFKSIS
jgi:hypothetical protein